MCVIVKKKKIPCALIDSAPLLIFSLAFQRSFRVRVVASQIAFRPIPFATSFETVPLAFPAELISLRVYRHPLFRVF